MKFKMSHNYFDLIEEFTEDTAPNWLRKGGLKNSTMCNRWFWHEHVKTLLVGQSIDTDFWRVTRTT